MATVYEIETVDQEEQTDYVLYILLPTCQICSFSSFFFLPLLETV